MMKRALLVAQREFLENVRTRGFWIGILMMPLMLVVIATVPVIVDNAREPKKFAVIDESGWLLEEVKTEIGHEAFAGRYRRVEPADKSLAALNTLIQEGRLFAYFVIGDDPVESSKGARYVSNNLTDRDLLDRFSELVTAAVYERRLQQARIDDATAAWVTEPLSFKGVQISNEGVELNVGTGDVVRQWAPVFFVYLLWVSILLNTQMLLTNTIEEKSNKVIEVLLSSISAIQLMAGKIIGIAATGLAVISAWAAMAIFFFIFLPSMTGLDLPVELSGIIGDPVYLGSFFVYFILGYLLYAAILVGLGSVCSNLKDAQNLMLPVQLIQIVPILVMIPIGRDPNGLLAQILSYVPPLTPFVMMNRAAAPPTTFEYIITTLLLVVSIIVALWIAARIFRVGILLSGKPPAILQLLRWFRTPFTGWKTGTSEG